MRAAPSIDQTRRNVLLPNGCATTFVPREDTVLRVTAGRLWVTFEAPDRGLAPRNGDHFIAAGASIDLLAGESAVWEAVGPEPAAYFNLEPVRTLLWCAAAQQPTANAHAALAKAVQVACSGLGRLGRSMRVIDVDWVRRCDACAESRRHLRGASTLRHSQKNR